MIHIHSNDPKIIHRDLTSKNVLLVNEILNNKSRADVKITDFGISKIIKND